MAALVRIVHPAPIEPHPQAVTEQRPADEANSGLRQEHAAIEVVRVEIVVGAADTGEHEGIDEMRLQWVQAVHQVEIQALLIEVGTARHARLEDGAVQVHLEREMRQEGMSVDDGGREPATRRTQSARRPRVTAFGGDRIAGLSGSRPNHPPARREAAPQKTTSQPTGLRHRRANEGAGAPARIRNASCFLPKLNRHTREGRMLGVTMLWQLRCGSRLIAPQERAGSQKLMMRIDKIRCCLRCTASLATQQCVATS